MVSFTYIFLILQVNLLTLGIPEAKLIRLRNPHGNSAEWKGAWSDRYWSFLTRELRACARASYRYRREPGATGIGHFLSF